MDTKGYYKILGLNENASEEEIKKSYRKASLKYHPDRQAGKTDKEKTEAEQKFKEINEAYSVLSDPNKKMNYDKYGNADAKGSGGFNFNEGFPFSDIGDLFGRQFGGNPFGGFSHQFIKPGSDIKMQIPLSIEDVFNGCTKKTKLHRNVRCPNCHGEGGSGKRPCMHCGGTGKEYIHQTTPLGPMEVSRTCPHCGGTGFVVDKVCPTCGGSGFKTSETVIEITFPAGMMEGFAITMPGQGNESKDKKGENGDFYAIAKYNFDTNKYTVKGLDVIEKIYIPYYDILLGCDYIVKIPNGTKKKINIASCTPEGKVLRLYREGIKTPQGQVGDYYVEVHYQMPESLSEEERKKLEDIKVINYKKDN